ncbi:MAG TPA: hypothetical protein QF784_00345, partial [Prochlorococcaceae cyanobacterium Fu_MAG_134]|nr:hypothetical protein [Prochlorococcaceae cyanobacterium Fu_MAG_134]
MTIIFKGLTALKCGDPFFKLDEPQDQALTQLAETMKLLTKQLFKGGWVLTNIHQKLPPRTNLADRIGAKLPVHLRTVNEARLAT